MPHFASILATFFFPQLLVLLLVCSSHIVHSSAANTKRNQVLPIYKVSSEWNTGFIVAVQFVIKKKIASGWSFNFQFNGALSRFECFEGNSANAVVGSTASNFRITNKTYNGVMDAGKRFKLECMAGLPDFARNQKPPPVSIYFQNVAIFRSKELTRPNSMPTLTTTSHAPSQEQIAQVLNGYFSNHQTSLNLPETSQEGENLSLNNLLDQHFSLVEPIETNQAGQISPQDQIHRRSTANDFEGSGTSSENNSSSTSKISTTSIPKHRPVYNITSKYNYTEVIHKSLLFFEAQRSGRLPENKRLYWTQSSALTDRGALGEDLTGGYYDAGDYVKFGFPMAFSMTMLAWGVIEYWDVYEAIGELSNVLDALRWGTDFFMKAHVSKYTLYGMIGNPIIEHKLWGRPDIIPERRAAYSISKKKGGSDLAGETSAALSAVSLALRKANNGETTPYIKELLRHAEELFVFAKTFRRKYQVSIKEAKRYYESTSYKDELVWAAAWLYRATGKKEYLKWAEGQYQNWAFFVFPSHMQFSWDDKRMGIQLLLAQMSTKFKKRYENVLLSYCNRLRSKKAPKTPGGLLYLGKWGPLRYAANSAFICLMAADNDLDADENRVFSQKQIHYMLGDSGRSYVIGFGKNYPKRPHHRASSCPPKPRQCDSSSLHSKKPNPIILYGALVGGPDKNDHYKDDRKEYVQSEVALDHNAGFQGAVAALLYQLMSPGKKISRAQEPWYPKESLKTPINNPKDSGGGSAAVVTSYISTFLALFLSFVLVAVIYR